MSAWTDAVAATTPYGWWKFDEASGATAADSSGNGHPGTYSSTGSLTYGVASLIPGDTGTAITFNGISPCMLVSGNGFSFNPIGATYAMTFKSSTDQTGVLFPTDSVTTELQINATTVNARIASGSSFVSVPLAYDPTSLFNGVAHFILWVIRASTTELWVDGVMVASGAHAAAGSNLNSLRNKGNFAGVAGTFDDLLLWKTDLSSTQIESLYADWSGVATPTTPKAAAPQTVTVGSSATASAVHKTTAAQAVTVATSAGASSVTIAAQTVTVDSAATAHPVGAPVATTATTSVVVQSAAIATAVPGVPVGSGTPLDLSTYVNLYASTTYDGTGLSGPSARFMFPVAEVDPAATYTFEFDYDTLEGFSQVSIASALGPTEAQADASNWWSLGTTDPLTGPAGTVTLTIGPGLGDWASAMAAGEHWLIFQSGVVRITGIRVTPAFGTAPVGGDPVAAVGGRSRSGLAVASWEPPVVMPPSVMVSGEHRRIRAAAFGPVSKVNGQPTYAVSEATAPRHRTRITVGGKDVSFLDGIPTPEPEWQLAEPLRWGPSSVELPSIPAAFFDPVDYPWLAKGKPVVYQRVDVAGNKLGVDYRGVVVAHDTSGKTLRLEIGGHAQGRAALRHKPLPLFKDTLDLGRLAWAAIRDLGLAFSPRLGPKTGIKQALFGGSDHLTHISELCAKAYDFDGQWTLMPDDAGRYTFARKDRTTVHWTLFNDDTRVVADLRSDAAEEPNRIFANGVTPRGQRVRFAVYPGLIPGPAAPYPFTDGRTFGLGTSDADTNTGDGVTVMLRKLWAAGYLSLEEADGRYDADVTRAIMSLQDDAGLATTGNINEATWAALFDLNVTGYNLRGARIEPAAQDYRVRRYNRSASGAIIGKNPNFDRNRLIVDREINFESGFTAHEMQAHSRAEVYRGEDNWFGTITIHGGAILRGNVEPGATITEADLSDVRDIKPGENVRLPLFGGDILLHISGVEITRTEGGHPVARLTVDTQARDAMPVWEMIRRNRETRRDPARRWKGNRASGVVKDSITEWDKVAGVVYGDRELVAGWNVIEVVGGQEGTVSRMRFRVHDADGDGMEFACAVFGKKVTAARLNTLVARPLANSVIPDPETDDDDEDEPKPPPLIGDRAWDRKSVKKVLRKKWHLYSAGTHQEPCGYSPGRKTWTTTTHQESNPDYNPTADKNSTGTDDDEFISVTTTVAHGKLTGKHEDDAGFSYRTDREPVLYLAVYVRRAGVLEGGRVMWNQLEAGA